MSSSLFAGINVIDEDVVTLSTNTDRIVKHHVAESIIVDYAKTLFDNKEVASKKECLAKVTEIVDTLMDRGELTISSKSIITDKINNFRHQTRLVVTESIVDRINTDCINSSMESIVVDESSSADEEQELANKFIIARDEYQKALKEMNNHFKSNIVNHTEAFLTKHKKLFSNEYLSKFNIK